MSTTEVDTEAGAGIVNAAWAGTGLFAAVSVLGVVFVDAFSILAAVIDAALFVVGVVAFLWAYAVSVSRSRLEAITLAGAFFLSGSAPKVVAFRLRLPLFMQIVVAIVAASIRPYTALAFGVLVPVFGLGLLGLWGARYGTFPPRNAPDRASES